jgi:hypothetical protein
VRNEVIKKQARMLNDLLVEIGACDPVFDLDYPGVAVSTAFMTLCAYGYIFSNHEELMERIRGNIAGQLYCGRKSRIDDIRVINLLPETESVLSAFSNSNEDVRRAQYERLKDGYVEVQWIYLTQRHLNFVRRLEFFRRDPFLPSRVKEALDRISAEINVNLTQHMKGIVEKCVKEFYQAYGIDPEANSRLNLIGVYNDFNHSRIHHTQSRDELALAVREYMGIDNVPW